MRSLNKGFLIITIILLSMILIPFSTVKAGLQANPNTHYKKADILNNWMLNMRKMEETGGAMGLNETLNADLTSSSESNNIDVHCVRSTEYGAVAILSASGYGNQQKLQESTIKTTTGNKTGVYFSGANWEYVAGGNEASVPNGANSIYYDSYSKDINITKVGDAMGTATTENPGCRGWHSASMFTWFRYNNYFVRGNGGLFSIYTMNYNGNGETNIACGRGVAVCGVGL